MLRILLRIIVQLGVVKLALLFSPLAHADETSGRALGDRALQTALQLEAAAETNLTISLNSASNISSDEESHKYSRLQILNGFDGSSSNEFLGAIDQYKATAIKSNDQIDIELASFFEDLSKVYNPYSVELSAKSSEALAFVRPHLSSENWHVKYSATILSAVFSSYQRDINQALEFASESFTTIPEEDSFNSQLARLYSYELTTYLHGVLKNPDRYISSIEGLLIASEKVGRPIESANYINNLIYALKGFDIAPEVMRQLVETLLRVGQAYPSETPGLVEMRAANALIRIGDFHKALPIARKGISSTENEMISNYLKIAEIQSLAALGQADIAQSELDAFQTLLSTGEATEAFADNEIFKAKGLIAMARGDANATFKNMDRHAELSIQRLLRSNNSDTSNLLANLENDKARQAEREAAREEMYRLEQEALTQRVNAAQRGLAIMIMLAIAALMTAAFMTYRSRTAIKLAKAAEAALAGEQAKTQFLAVISHELRTPLNGIIGIADLLSRTAPTDQLRSQISIVNNSGQDLLRLVEQILDMSRIDANEMEVFPEVCEIRDVISSVEALWRPTIEANEVIFTCYVDTLVPEFLILDPMRLRQCVNNLVSNAAKFTKQGRVHLHVLAVPSETDKRTDLEIVVADTGMGIRREVQDNLFRPFVQADSSITRQYGGSGLGLAITRSLARLMGGDLTVNSRPDAGSEFKLTLDVELTEDSFLLNTMEELFAEVEDAPAEDIGVTPQDVPVRQNVTVNSGEEYIDLDITDIAVQPKAEPTPLPMPDFDQLDGVRVLIVEDIISNQDVMKVFLEPEGCDIVCANDGVQALMALKSQDFDVVLMDIRMPQMDGIEATRIIRGEIGRNQDIPIIALTADATAETNAQCMAAGANIFLTKPIIATELFDSIRFVRKQSFNRAELKQVERGIISTPKRLSA